ncbi:vWA domain-containing protein [Halalkalibacter urbisdiaboli]|uniref:vWA domain-containing protein n=1 Tax=Halalkalibacter urbisdiaboli TaxID=1960589 RepID=UPI000B437481|nr:VWA domain-containing protein [Halalkalibacter urbisdiaboli]
MVKFWFVQYFIYLVVLGAIIGCSKENTDAINEEQVILQDRDLEVEEVDEIDETEEVASTVALASIEKNLIPSSLEEVLEFPVGPFAGLEFDEEDEQVIEALKQLPVLDEDASDEEIEQYLYNLLLLFAEDYPDPTALVNRWEQLSFGSPEVEDPRYEVKENFNVEIILDSSGSMKEEIGGRQKLDVAKEAIKEFMKQLPEEANVALRVYGHIGESEEVSCKRADRVYDLQPYHEADFTETLEEFYPNGWTPIAYALEQTKKDFAELKGENNTNVIYLVSDGIETCNGDPVQVAKELGESEIMPIVNVIGFDVPSDEQQQLKDMAKAAEGVYASAENQEQLKEELNRTNEMAKLWRDWKTNAIKTTLKTVHEQKGEIFDEKYNWKGKVIQEGNNVIFCAKYLWLEEEKLTLDHKLYMTEIINDRKESLHNIGNSIYDGLRDSNRETYESMREEIENMYEKQVQN